MANALFIQTGNNMKHVLMVGGRDHTIHKFQKLGLNYTVIQKHDLVTDLQIKTSQKLIVMDYKNSDELIQVATALHKINPFDAIISFAEYGMYPAAICSQCLGLPSNNIFSVDNTRDKLKMRRLLQQNELATVMFKLCNTLEDVHMFFDSMHGKPIIIKPSASAGSRGVSFIDKKEQIEKAWEWTANVGVFPILAEEYIDGNEYSIETLSKDGQHEITMITEKLTTGYPNFIEKGHQVPARLSNIKREKIQNIVFRFLDVIQQKTGPTHTEIKINDDDIKIIESQTRIGGDQIWEMSEMVSGIDQMSETICHLLDLPKPPRFKQFESVAIRFFVNEDMKVNEIKGIEEASKLPGVIRVHCKTKAGDSLGSLKSSDSRQGYVLASGDTVEQAIKNVNHAINAVTFI